MPVEPAPSVWLPPDPRSAGSEDVVAVGADLEPGTVLAAYRHGMFPMHLRDGRLGWWSPLERAVLPLDGLRVTRSLRKSCRRYRLTVDEATREVIDGCADPVRRPDVWITDQFRATYLALYELGWVHSVEVWAGEGDLAGGLYGVGIGALFCGESMFSRQRDASKVALMHLVSILARVPEAMLDVQWVTPHLATLGAVAIGREEYLRRLPAAIAARSPWS